MKFIGKCLLVEAGEKRVLVIGDLHLGWEESLNRSGVFISRKLFEEMIDYLDRVFVEAGGVDEVVLLGDVKHEFGTIMRQEWNDIGRFFDYLLGKIKKVVVVKGNHDIVLEPIVRKYEGVCLKDYYIFGDTAFMHGDKDFIGVHLKNVKGWVVGHGHPAVRLVEKGGAKIEKFKCFLVGNFKGREIVIVPSFFEGSVGNDPRENEFVFPWKFDLDEFDVKVVGEENLKVLNFGKLKKINKICN